MTLYLIFLILEIVLIMFGVFMGYRRGMGKALFRFCELVIIAVVSLFVSRSLAFSLVDGSKDMVFSLLDPSAAQMLSSSENAIAFIISLAGALIAPVIFALIFGFLKLITLIGFNSVSGAVIRKAGEGKSSKWGAPQ